MKWIHFDLIVTVTWKNLEDRVVNAAVVFVHESHLLWLIEPRYIANIDYDFVCILWSWILWEILLFSHTYLWPRQGTYTYMQNWSTPNKHLFTQIILTNFVKFRICRTVLLYFCFMEHLRHYHIRNRKPHFTLFWTSISSRETKILYHRHIEITEV